MLSENKAYLSVFRFTFISAFLVVINYGSGQAWVNEFHYDNTGGDTEEFFEVFVENGTTLADIDLTLYNDAGAVYDSLNLSADFTLGANNVYGTFYAIDHSGIQNGPSDGWSLSDSGGVIEFLSYEGTLTATAGPANGMTSTDIGVSQPSSTPIGSSLGLEGSGNQVSDFTWTSFPAAERTANPFAGNTGPTVAFENTGQTFIPEPSTYALIFGGIALGVVFIKRKLEKGNG